MTELAACGNRKQKQRIEKCENIDQNKQIVFVGSTM